jgi:hypothetical protein
MTLSSVGNHLPSDSVMPQNSPVFCFLLLWMKYYTFQNYAELKSVFKEVFHKPCGNLAWGSAQRSVVETAVLTQWYCIKWHSLNFKQKPRNYDRMFELYIQSFIHSIGMCRMWPFLATLWSVFHPSLLYTLSFHPFPPTTSLPSSCTSSCHLFLGLPQPCCF